MTPAVERNLASEFLHSGKKSILERKWQIHTPDFRQTLALAQHLELHQLVAQLLVTRGFNVTTAPLYLNPTLKELLPDPTHLLDIQKAISRVEHAFRNKEKIVIFADYDVDGATASALLRRYCRDIGFSVGLYIPDRIDEGYGPNAPALKRLKQEGYDLVIMVDCGTTAFEPLEVASMVSRVVNKRLPRSA